MRLNSWLTADRVYRANMVWVDQVGFLRVQTSGTKQHRVFQHAQKRTRMRPNASGPFLFADRLMG